MSSSGPYLKAWRGLTLLQSKLAHSACCHFKMACDFNTLLWYKRGSFSCCGFPFLKFPSCSREPDHLCACSLLTLDCLCVRSLLTLPAGCDPLKTLTAHHHDTAISLPWVWSPNDTSDSVVSLQPIWMAISVLVTLLSHCVHSTLCPP